MKKKHLLDKGKYGYTNYNSDKFTDKFPAHLVTMLPLCKVKVYIIIYFMNGFE